MCQNNPGEHPPGDKECHGMSPSQLASPVGHALSENRRNNRFHLSCCIHRTVPFNCPDQDTTLKLFQT